MQKNSFILYKDNANFINKLSDKQAGQLIKNIFAYVNGQELSEIDPIAEGIFLVMQNQLLRDKEKWDREIIERKKAGKLGGLAKASKGKQSLANIASAKSAKQNLAKLGDSVTVTVSVSEIQELYIYFKERINSSVTLTEKAQVKITCRLNKYDINQLKLAIDRFAGCKWRMDNNKDKPLSWFFKSDEQIETFLLLKQDTGKERSILNQLGGENV